MIVYFATFSQDIFPDKATDRKILSLVILCPSAGCDWTGELRGKEVTNAPAIYTLLAYAIS